MIVPIDFILLFFLVVTAIAAITVKDLFAAIVLLGAYSFIMANMWLQLGASDVAFTEAAVGAGTSTALLVAALSRLSRKARWEK
jgi:multicomponent Na+:H+ antiporter subunit B